MELAAVIVSREKNEKMRRLREEQERQPKQWLQAEEQERLEEMRQLGGAKAREEGMRREKEITASNKIGQAEKS